MKSKINIVLIVCSVFLFLLIFNNNSEKNTIDKSQLVAMNFIKCTPPSFLLDPIDSTQQIAPLFENLGKHTYKVSTEVKKAQIFFNQGLNLAFAFNHSESHRSFLEASRLDPNLAMSYWGQAYVLGPNINDPFPDEERRKNARKAIQKAIKLSKNATEKEQDLVKALSKRFSNDTIAISELNTAYMEAMRPLAAKYAEDADVQTLFAASIMNTVPWNYWDKDGNPSPNIPAAKEALETAIQLNPDHPGAHHYYIHMVELPKPDLGVASADKLATLMTGAGHMVHMPGHIYMRVGRYLDAAEANVKAIKVDEDYISQCYAQGMYPLGYYPHNIHFLWYASSMLGDSETAIEAARKTADKVPLNELINNNWYQRFASTPMLANLRFGKWNDILTTPNSGDDYDHLSTIRKYTRGIAFLRKNNLKEAKEELQLLGERDTSLFSERTAKVAYEVLAGEIEFYKGNIDAAISHLKTAVVYEDELPYDEPSVWYIPTRQTLGHILLKATLYKEAEEVYLEDLAYYRNNGWSLMGLHKSLKGQNRIEEAEKVLADFKESWKHADIEIDSSIL